MLGGALSAMLYPRFDEMVERLRLVLDKYVINRILDLFPSLDFACVDMLYDTLMFWFYQRLYQMRCWSCGYDGEVLARHS